MISGGSEPAEPLNSHAAARQGRQACISKPFIFRPYTVRIGCFFCISLKDFLIIFDDVRDVFGPVFARTAFDFRG